jgi:plasmid stabilization system protein ParE
MRYYEHQSGRRLAEDFYQKFMEAAEAAASHPKRYHFGAKNLRRVNLKRFPYHLLFREGTQKIFVVVVRHHERHPNFGLNRVAS